MGTFFRGIQTYTYTEEHTDMRGVITTGTNGVEQAKSLIAEGYVTDTHFTIGTEYTAILHKPRKRDTVMLTVDLTTGQYEQIYSLLSYPMEYHRGDTKHIVRVLKGRQPRTNGFIKWTREGYATA